MRYFKVEMNSKLGQLLWAQEEWKAKIIYREDGVDIGSLVRGENLGLNTASSASTWMSIDVLYETTFKCHKNDMLQF